MYTVTFSDGTIWKGGEPLKSNWNDMPKKPIAKLDYQVGSQTICFQGYQAYNHIVEKSIILSRGIQSIKLMLMVKKGEDVLILMYDFKVKKIEYDTKIFGHEYNGKVTKGWKEGIEGLKPKTEFI